MSLFNREKAEKTYEENGYLIGVDSNLIYHVPRGLTVYNLPSSAIGIKDTAITEMSGSVEKIVVPGNFKKFGGNFQFCKKLKLITLLDGVEEINCQVKTGAVDFHLPTTIKKIGKDNYPITQNLVIPNGVIELSKMFASHDVYLKSVEIPGTIKNLPSYCFNQCKNLESIILNEGVETCEQNSFRNVNKLQTLKIPNTFNGYFDLSMENRATSSLRGNSRYDGMNIEQEKKETLCIFLKRDEKNFEFRIKRGA